MKTAYVVYKIEDEEHSSDVGLIFLTKQKAKEKILELVKEDLDNDVCYGYYICERELVQD